MFLYIGLNIPSCDKMVQNHQEGQAVAKFIVAPALFELFPEACFGVVVAEEVDNQVGSEVVTNMLEAQVRR